MDKMIVEFLDKKKADFIKKKIKAIINKDEEITFKQEASDKFSLQNWLIDASNRASQLSITSHPAKFIHPDAKTTSIIANCSQKNDGLLRSGNVAVDLDVSGNAAALDVEKFLRIELEDKQSILQHLEQNTDAIQKQFNIKNINYNSVRENFLKIKTSDLDQTSNKLKQVYFPVDGDYHLLSILNPSGIIYKLKQKINDIRFSDENKEVREAIKKQTSINGKIEDVKGLTGIGYGGTKTLNISMLNYKNGGVSFLLPSMPPLLKKRKTQPPKTDFFDNCLWKKLFQDEFKYFHEVLVWRKNNIDIRDKRDDIVISSIIKAQRIIDNIRNIDIGWSDSETYNDLDKWQKIWLDNQFQETREDGKQNHHYLEKAQSSFANWFIGNYKTTKDAKTLGSEDIDHIKTILSQEQDLLK